MSPEEFEQLLPLATAWVQEQETRILTSGVDLTSAQLSDARQMGVAHPERVRLLSVARVPVPEHPILRAAAATTGMVSPLTVGLTLRYGIYLRDQFATDRFLVAHELVHTGQYERWGGIAAFLRQYLQECFTIGYPDAPMEQEAIQRSNRLRKPSN
jgi:hypothetical protein